MEIIVRGIHPDDRLYEITCDTCASVFRFSRIEAECGWSVVYDEHRVTVDCPVCDQTCSKTSDDYTLPQ